MLDSDFIENINPSYFFFPFEYSKIQNFFDFAPIIKYTFGVSIKGEDDYPMPTEIPRTDITKLSNVEKRVLYGLIKYPDIPDSKIAENIAVTRQVVSKLKKSFEIDGILRTIRIPRTRSMSAICFQPKSPFLFMVKLSKRVYLKVVEKKRKF